jgi:hypothetical protein
MLHPREVPSQSGFASVLSPVEGAVTCTVGEAFGKGGLAMGVWEQMLHLFLVIVIATLGGLILGGITLIGLVRIQIRDR